jgi:TPR repeat protein
MLLRGGRQSYHGFSRAPRAFPLDKDQPRRQSIALLYEMPACSPSSPAHFSNSIHDANPPNRRSGKRNRRRACRKIDEAETLLSAAAEKNSDQARWLLARLHGAGKIKAASLQTARKLLEAAAQAGYGPAAYDLARLAEAGALSEGKPDKDQTVFYFKGAAESGLPSRSIVWEIML